MAVAEIRALPESVDPPDMEEGSREQNNSVINPVNSISAINLLLFEFIITILLDSGRFTYRKQCKIELVHL